jgi:hypothetical protein
VATSNPRRRAMMSLFFIPLALRPGCAVDWEARLEFLALVLWHRVLSTGLMGEQGYASAFTDQVLG